MYSNGPGPPPPHQHYQQPPQPPPHQHHYEQPPYQQAQYGPPSHGHYSNEGHHYSNNYRYKRGGKNHYGGNRHYYANYSGPPEAPSPPNHSSGPYQQPNHYGQHAYPQQQQQQQHHQQRPPTYPPQQQYQQHQNYAAPSPYPPPHGYQPAQQYGPPSNPPPTQPYPPSAPPYHQQYPPAGHQPPHGYHASHGYPPPQEYAAPPPQSYPPQQPYPPPPQHNSQGYSHSQPYQQWQGQPHQNSQYSHYGSQPSHHDGRYHNANGHANRPVNGASVGDANYSPRYQPSESHRRQSYSQGRFAQTNVPSDTQTDASDSNEGAQQGRSSFYSSADDWGFDFDGALWPKGNDAVDPALSIGIIIWHPAKQATRALPSNFERAEELATQPPPKSLGNAESVSLYFALENSHEAFLDVRQTDDWPNVEDDSIFYEFPAKCDTVPLEEVIALRNRPGFPEEYSSRNEMIEDGEVSERGSDWNVMDHLEEALGGTDADKQRNFISKGQDQDSVLKDTSALKLGEKEEELLALLGVSGLPKPVQPGPVAVSQAADTRTDAVGKRSGDFSNISSVSDAKAEPMRQDSVPQRSRNSVSAVPQPPSMPKEAEDVSSNPWVAAHPSHTDVDDSNHRKESPACSESSQHTLAGSDFHAEHTNPVDRTTVPKDEADTKENRTIVPAANTDGHLSRKRSHAESAAEGAMRQDEENLPRSSKRRHPQVDAAYSRRW